MKIKQIITGVMTAVLLCVPVTGVYASDGEEYITITVEASDDNEGITYALDSDDPGSFGPSNMFTIPAGTPHTIYVKDAAGNVTSQVYEPPEPETVTAGDSNTHEEDNSPGTTDQKEKDGSIYDDVNVNGTYDGQTIDIDLELGKNTGNGDEKPYEIKRDTPAEQGEGTVYSKTFLDGTDSSGQVFYSMTTAEGNVYYLLIDQGQESNNVYLLNQVTDQDLRALAADSGSDGASDKEDDNLLKALSGSGNEEGGTDTGRTSPKGGGVNRNAIILLIFMAAAGGFYYYQKVYKTKKEQEMDAMEAPDMDQFVASGDNDDGEEFDFEYGDEDKDEYLRNLILEDEMEYAAAAENEAERTGWDTGEESGMDEPEEDIFTEPTDGTDDIFADTGDNEYDPEIDDDDENEE